MSESAGSKSVESESVESASDEYALDARRLLCPLPVIRVQDRVRQLAPGARLRVYCTDPGAKADVPAWCRVHGHRVLDVVESHDEVIILIETGVS